MFIQMRQPICIETFSGAGGMSLGLSDAGFKVAYAFDNDEAAVKSYNENISAHCDQLDARTVTGEQLLQKAGVDQLDLLSGGPPCQGFSKQKRGAHLSADERNGLVLEYARLVEETAAKTFLFENVQIFGQKRGADLISALESRLEQYKIYRYFVCSSDFGLAQRRSRFMMIGIRRDEAHCVPALEFSNRFVTVRDAIGDLPPPPENFKEHPDVPNHIKCRITKANEERIKHVPPGGGWPDIPNHLRLECHKGVNTSKGGWPDVYGRLEWNGQCPTITAGFDSFSRGRYAHPEQHRSLTLREGARLQGFSDRFRFFGTRHNIRLQIGNAVPPPLAKAAGEAILRALDNKLGCAETMQFPIGYEAESRLAS